MTDVAAMAFDVDGTLLTSAVKLPDETHDVLRACHGRGIAIYVATARPPKTVFRPVETTRDCEFVVAQGVYLNGALLVDGPSGFRQERLISADVVAAIADELRGLDEEAQIIVQQIPDFHAFRNAQDTDGLTALGIIPVDVAPFEEAMRSPAAKILVHWWTGDLAETAERLRGRCGDAIHMIAATTHIQITAATATKEDGLATLLAVRGIDPAATAVFGDMTADIGMIRRFGYGIAMGNASDDVKAAADFVTDTNDNGGIVKAIRDYLEIS